MQPILTPQQKEQFIEQGHVVARGLLTPQIVSDTREAMLNVLGIEPHDPQTWEGKSVVSQPAALALTKACRTREVEAVAQELVGPHTVPGVAFSPFLEAKGAEEPLISGFIPVLNFPSDGPREFVPPNGYHIDGMHRTTLWPEKFFLVVFAYLSDTAEYGGATTVLPGSHRQVFEHWLTTGNAGNTQPPPLEYAAPIPMAGQAGDVIFMHYLTVHSGSENRSDHIRVGLNTAVMPDPQRPYQRKSGAPNADWTPLDHTLRTDNLSKSVSMQDKVL